METVELVKAYLEEKRDDITVEIVSRDTPSGIPWYGVVDVTLKKPRREFQIRSMETKLYNDCGKLDLHHPQSLKVLEKVVACHMRGDCDECPFIPVLKFKL